MNTLELKIPPVVVVAMTGGLMWGVSQLLPNLEVLAEYQWMARPFWIAAVIVMVGGILQFAVKRTTVDPHRVGRATSLVTGGLYRLTRNPMYLGMFLGLAGLVFYLANLAAIVGLPAFIAYMDRFQIEPEERKLTELFGDEYTAYLARTRRWL